jgi:hypothetical protein
VLRRRRARAAGFGVEVATYRQRPLGGGQVVRAGQIGQVAGEIGDQAEWIALRILLGSEGTEYGGVRHRVMPPGVRLDELGGGHGPGSEQDHHVGVGLPARPGLDHLDQVRRVALSLQRRDRGPCRRRISIENDGYASLGFERAKGRHLDVAPEALRHGRWRRAAHGGGW